MGAPIRRLAPDARRVPRPLHPLAWWAWALGLAVAVSRTTNPLLLGLVVGVLGLVVARRRGDAPWSRAFRSYLLLALGVITARLLFRSVLGGDVDPATMHVWFSLPRVPLPAWAAGVQLGGPVTAEGTLSALYDGMTLGSLLCCVGAANALANPKRALRVLPGALYELGVAVVVSLTVAPQLVESVQRVRRATRLRGRPGGAARALRGVAVPVLQDALDRSLQLAAAMDARGYGRTGEVADGSRRVTGGLVVTGMGGLCLGAYGLLGQGTPPVLGVTALVVGSALCLAGIVVGGRRVRRTRYRPDPWAGPEWAVALCGLAPAVVFGAALGAGATGLHPPTAPLGWPTLPPVPALAVLVAALPAVVAPPPASPAAPPGRVGVARAVAGRAPVAGPSLQREPS